MTLKLPGWRLALSSPQAHHEGLLLRSGQGSPMALFSLGPSHWSSGLCRQAGEWSQAMDE